VWRQDVLDLELPEPVDMIVSAAAPHGVIDHDRLWVRPARTMRPGGIPEVQCGGAGNIHRVREVIKTLAVTRSRSWPAGRRGCSQARNGRSGGQARPASARSMLAGRPAHLPEDVGTLARTSIPAAISPACPVGGPRTESKRRYQVTGFRDYQSVIQAGAGRDDGTRHVPLDPEEVRALFDRMVREAWTPAEIEILHRAACSALL
jgi:hypothetical protein